MVEKPKREEQQDDSDHHSPKHPVELYDTALILIGTGLKRTVLTSICHQVDVDITVLIALLLVVDGRISDAELFADTGHKIRRLIDG